MVLAHGSPDLIARIERGERRVSRVAIEIRLEAARRRASSASQRPQSRIAVCADVRNPPLRGNSVDWILCDPPYGQQHLELYEHLGDFAARVLKPGGGLLCLTGQSYLPDAINALSRRLRYHWVLSYLCPHAATPIHQRKVGARWKPVLWFQKGKYAGGWIGSDVCSAGASNEPLHPWQQNGAGMVDLLHRFVRPGMILCDPLCGTGTSGIAATQLGCRFVALDRDLKMVAMTRDRLAP